MAILINDIIQGIGADVVSIEELESVNMEPGIHILNSEKTIMDITNDSWAVYCSYDQDLKVGRSQIWIPLHDNEETTEVFFIRTASKRGHWSIFRKYSSGDKLITIKDFEDNIFNLVDNTDPLNPKIKQDDTKADKVTGDFTENSLAKLDTNGNLVSSEKQADWIKDYTIDIVDEYEVELYFASGYDKEETHESEYDGYCYGTFTSAEVIFEIRDREGNVINANNVELKELTPLNAGNNSLFFVKQTSVSNEYAGVPANALVFNGCKSYRENQSQTYVGSIQATLVIDFAVNGVSYVEEKYIKIKGFHGKRNVWLEQGEGTNKYRLESTYVDPVTGKNPQFYNSETVDVKVNHITIPAGHEGQLMVYGDPTKPGDVYRWLDVTDTISGENDRVNTSIPTEKAIADYVDSQVSDKGITGFEYNKENHKLTITKQDSSLLQTVIPLASSTVDGLMTKDDKASIAGIIADISMLSGKARLVGNVGEHATAADIQAFWESIKGTGISPEEMMGSVVVNLDQDPPAGHAWMFMQDVDGNYTWIDRGVDSVSKATNHSLGMVKGVEPVTGYNYHVNFINQVGSGLNYLTKTLTNTVDSSFTVKITGVDGAGNITDYELNPKTGPMSKFLSRVEFTNSDIGNEVFRFDITSLSMAPTEGYCQVNSAGELYVNGFDTIREQIEYQLDNKVDKKGINLRSTDGYITVTGESPNFAIGLNVAGSRQMIDLTNIMDGITDTWDLATLPQGEDIQGSVSFWYGDGRLIPGRDYTFSDFTTDNFKGQPQYGTKILKCLNTPVWNPSENRTLYVEIEKMSLISDIRGIGQIVSDDGSLIFNKQGDIGYMTVNTVQVLENTKKKIVTPTESTTMISEGTVMEYIKSLSDNVRYLLDNAVWKNSNTDLPLKIAFQTSTVAPEAGVNKIHINPNDLGQE